MSKYGENYFEGYEVMQN